MGHVEDEAVGLGRVFGGGDEIVERGAVAEKVVQGPGDRAPRRFGEEGLGQRGAGEMRPVDAGRSVAPADHLDRQPARRRPIRNGDGRARGPGEAERVDREDRRQVLGREGQSAPAGGGDSRFGEATGRDAKRERRLQRLVGQDERSEAVERGGHGHLFNPRLTL